MIYFAYGSNMLSGRLQERCSSAKSLGHAVLKGYALRWHKRSDDGSGKCDAVKASEVKAPEAAVHGVLYEIIASEESKLDKAEGLGFGYKKAEVPVLFRGVEHRAITYLATKTDESLHPYSWYHSFVLAGAREHNLPEDYIAKIKAVTCIEDPDRGRHNKNLISLIKWVRA